MSGVLSNLSNSLAELVTAAGPSVARVEGRSRFPATGVVWSSEGVIVTSHHVLESDEGLQVGLGDGQSVPASLVGRDPSTDLAVLRTSARGLAAPAWANGDDLKVGHLVLALGRPGKSVRATLGIVSALAVNDSLTFSELKALLKTTDGNLSVHARKLEEAAYISCTKSFDGRLPKTEYRLTAPGRRALERYLDHMEALIRATRER